MFKRLIAVWIDYRIHHISEITVKCLLGLLLVGLPAAPVAVHQYAVHHKLSEKPKTATSNSAAKPKVQPPPTKKVAVTKPPASAVSAPAPDSSQPPVQAPKTIPVPVTQPTPGSGAKKLSQAPPPQTTPSASNNPPADPNPDTSTSTTAASASTPSTASQAPTYATGGYTSTNWSGYVATAGNYKHISGSWVVPSATGNGSTTTADSTWIGIGGVFSEDLIQTGTMNSVSAGGQISSAAFYELLPDTALEIPSIPVSPGDSMSAAIDEISAGTWTISITDTTASQTFTTTVNYTSNYSSAEWIEEDPSYANGSLVPFDHFSPAQFVSGKVTINGAVSTISAANSSPITLVDQGGNPLARPTVLTTDGTGFTVYRQ